MPKLVINPRLENNIRLIDYRKYANAGLERQQELMRWYEGGDLLVLTNYRFDAGREVFSRVLFPNEKRAKKIMLHCEELDHGEPPRKAAWDVAAEFLPACNVSPEEFRAAVLAANQELITLVDTLFPHYRYDKRLCIYNLSEMLSHNLHFDSPQHADAHTQMRAFVNLDDFPRIWNISRRLEDVSSEFYQKGHLEETIGEHPREFTRRLTHAAFGDRYDSGGHFQPKHAVAFQPGEVWFLNPNMLAHEVVYGRRLLDAVFLFDQACLLDPDRYFPTIVQRLHEQKLTAPGYWWRKALKSMRPRRPAKHKA